MNRDARTGRAAAPHSALAKLAIGDRVLSLRCRRRHHQYACVRSLRRNFERPREQLLARRTLY